ncbi:MAG: GTP-binding protein [Thermoplasmata archaeon]|nr:MAG: GTP-binding protein [Thermoplasmata archaeon]
MAIKKKIVLLGDSAVGKTSLIRRFVFDQFEDSYTSTIGSKVTMKEFSIHRSNANVDVKFMIWDIIGREGYHALHARTFVGVEGAILVADLTRKETLENLEKYWIPFLFKIVENVPLVFTCNKSDLKGKYEFGFEDMEDLAGRYSGQSLKTTFQGLKSCYATSAKDGNNVECAFESLGNFMLSEYKPDNTVEILLETLFATGIQRNLDKTTPIGALDAIMVDFCKDFKDSRIAMLILRQELARAKIDVNNPTKEKILTAVEYLAEAESEFKDRDIVLANMKRRREWAESIVGD